MGDDIKLDDPVKKTKKKVWKFCKCSCGWGFLGLAFFATGIGLLVAFSKYWDDQDHWERGLAYTGAAFIILGFILLAVGISLCVFLIIIYKKVTGDHSTKTMFHPPKYEYGKAPYPQQPPFNPEPPGDTEPGNSPSAPPQTHSEQSGTGAGDVTIEVAEHHKF